MDNLIKNKIIDFMQNNQLNFLPGSRNNDSVVLAGYCLHINRDIDVNAIINIIDITAHPTIDISTEFKRVFHYAKCNNYERFWETAECQAKYTY